MKIFPIFLVLIILFKNLSYADDIRDFEIEGISIGDNLTKHMSKNEIFKNNQGHYSKESKFFETQLSSGKGKYEYLLFHVKRNDRKFKIHVIRGANEVSSYEECMKEKKSAVNELKKIFTKTKLREGNQKHYFYKNSTQYISQFEFKNGDLVKLECTIYDKKDEEIHGELIDLFDVSIGTNEFYSWLARQ